MADQLHLLVAFDIGYEVAVDKARELAHKMAPTEPHERRLPRRYLEYQVAPAEIDLGERSIQLGDRDFDAKTSARLFDFGGLAISLKVVLPDPRTERLWVSQCARFRPPVETARLLASDLIERLRPAINRPSLAEPYETYAVFEERGTETDSSDLIERERSYLAEMLRGEGGPLSVQETDDARKQFVSFSPRDLVIADYDAAILWGLDPPDVEDVLDILEFANLQLLELRMIDRMLDRRIGELYGPESAWRHRLFRSPLHGDLRQRLNALAELKLDSMLLGERLENAFKIIGDLYYARIYRATASRLHLDEWRSSTERKLDVVDDTYNAIAARIDSRRLELLEWTVVVLILAEIVIGLVRR